MKKKLLSLSAILLILILFLGFVLNFSLVIKPPSPFPFNRNNKPFSVSEYTDFVSKNLKENFSGKFSFLNLNGLFCRITGRRVSNKVVRLNNGYLSNETIDEVDVTPLSDSVVKLSEFSEKNGADFIFVQAPYKLDRFNTLLPEGISNYANHNSDRLLNVLSYRGIDCLDLRPYLSETPAQVSKYFYITDHHWNYTGAFVGFSEILSYLNEKYPDANIDMNCANIKNWSMYSLEDWFFGSHGKRTGIPFSGYEDFVYYLPRFETKMSMDITDPFEKEYTHFSGNFYSTNVRDWYLARRPHPYNNNLYDLFIGGEYQLVTHECETASSDLRLLLIKDSFMLPLQAYMSTAFKHIDVFDPRIAKPNDVFDYIKELKPDVVIMMISAGNIEEDYAYIF